MSREILIPSQNWVAETPKKSRMRRTRTLIEGRGIQRKAKKDKDVSGKKDAVRGIHGKALKGEGEQGSNGGKPAYGAEQHSVLLYCMI